MAIINYQDGLQSQAASVVFSWLEFAIHLAQFLLETMQVEDMLIRKDKRLALCYSKFNYVDYEIISYSREPVFFLCNYRLKM